MIGGGGAGRAAKRLRRHHVLGVRAIGSPLNALVVVDFARVNPAVRGSRSDRLSLSPMKRA
jgi:hypothetical protein